MTEFRIDPILNKKKYKILLRPRDFPIREPKVIYTNFKIHGKYITLKILYELGKGTIEDIHNQTIKLEKRSKAIEKSYLDRLEEMGLVKRNKKLYEITKFGKEIVEQLLM